MIVIMGSHTASWQVLCDRHPLPGEYLMGHELRQALDGGKGSNQAIAAAKFGGQVQFISRIGTDAEGDKLLDYCSRYGVGVKGITRSRKATGVGYAFVDKKGIPMGITVPGCLDEINEKVVMENQKLVEQANVFLTQLEIPVDTALCGCRMAHDAGALTILNPAPADALHLSEDMSYIDVLTPNENEARCLAGVLEKKNVSIEDVGRLIYEHSKISTILITLGEKGILLCENGQVSYQEAFPVKAVDTSGAGDCFNAVLACRLAEGNAVKEAVRYAQAAAAFSVQYSEVWSSYPTKADTEEFMRK